MHRVSHKNFYDERIDCNGVHFHGVIFDGCVLLLTRDGAKTTFTGGTSGFYCKMIGDGWSPETLELNAAHLSQRTDPLHEVEALLTKAERAAYRRVQPISINRAPVSWWHNRSVK